jgi:hypothetical protein
VLFRLALTFAFCLLPFALAPADEPDKPEPPVRLKKKVRPKADKPSAPEKAKPDEEDLRPREVPERKRLSRPGAKAKDDEPDDLKEPEVNPQEILARITKNMRSVEDRLAKKDAGEGTRQVQRDILKDLDALIEQNRRQQQRQRQQQAGGMSRDMQNLRGQQRRHQEEMQEQLMRRQQMAGRTGGGGGKSGGRSKVADLYKDIWGHLPETLRQEMDAYSRERFMAKYNDLLKQYYATIAEKGRQKGD